MKFEIFSLFIICCSCKTMGRMVVTEEPSILNSQHYVIPYKSICYHVKVEGDEVETNELSAASLAVEENIKDRIKTEGNEASYYITSMCFQDDKIKSLSENLVNKRCASKADKSKVVQDLVNETCGFAYTDLVTPILMKNQDQETAANPQTKEGN